MEGKDLYCSKCAKQRNSGRVFAMIGQSIVTGLRRLLAVIFRLYGGEVVALSDLHSVARLLNSVYHIIVPIGIAAHGRDDQVVDAGLTRGI